MSVMSNLDLAVREVAGENDTLYIELTMEINSYLKGYLKLEELTLMAQEILEEAGAIC